MRLRLLDVLADARDAQRGEPGVVADEVLDQRLKVDQRVVHRRRRQQHDLLRAAGGDHPVNSTERCAPELRRLCASSMTMSE